MFAVRYSTLWLSGSPLALAHCESSLFSLSAFVAVVFASFSLFFSLALAKSSVCLSVRLSACVLLAATLTSIRRPEGSVISIIKLEQSQSIHFYSYKKKTSSLSFANLKCREFSYTHTLSHPTIKLLASLSPKVPQQIKREATRSKQITKSHQN